MAKSPYTPGMKSSPKMAGGGLKKPTYSGADRARSSSKGTRSSQSPAYTKGAASTGGGMPKKGY